MASIYFIQVLCVCRLKGNQTHNKKMHRKKSLQRHFCRVCAAVLEQTTDLLTQTATASHQRRRTYGTAVVNVQMTKSLKCFLC